MQRIRRPLVSTLAIACFLTVLWECISGSPTSSGGGGDVNNVSSVQLAADSIEITAGDTTRIAPTALDANGNVVKNIAFTFSSSDTTVAKVDNRGLVSTSGFGEADIDIVVAGASGSFQGGVSASRVSARGAGTRSRARLFSRPIVTIRPLYAVTDVGGQVTFTASLTDLNGNAFNNPPVPRWSSSSPGIATIDISGIAHGVSEGVTSITAAVIRGIAEYDASVSLRVSKCGGIFQVASWTAIVTATYSASKTIGDGTITVFQHDSASAILARPGPDSSYFEGQLNGIAKVSNQQTTSGGPPTTESANGALSAPISKIAFWIVDRGPDANGHEQCGYSMKYLAYSADTLFLPQTSFGGGPQPHDPVLISDVEAAVNETIPSSTGTFTLQGDWQVPGYLVNPNLLDIEITPVIRSYAPASVLAGLLMAAVTQGSLSATFGTAHVTYTITGHQ